MSSYGQPVGFPQPTLTKLNANPSFGSYQTHLRELVQSLGNHPTHLGGGAHGFIGALTVGNNALYNELTSNALAFVVPVHPGANPNVPAGATQHMIQEQNRIHARDLATYTAYHGNVNATKTALLEAVGEKFFHSLRHRTTGFLNVTLTQLFDLYRNKCEEPDQLELDDNDDLFKKPYDPSQTVSQTFATKKNCQDFATGTAMAITNAALLHRIKRAFTQSQIKEFKDGVSKFEARVAADQTLANLEIDLCKAEKQYKINLKETPTIAEAGYNSANAAKAVSGHNSANATKEVPNAVLQEIVNKLGYCYTHGLVKDKRHNSKTCRSKCPEHKDEATFTNMMGGNKAIFASPWNNENKSGQWNNNRNNGRWNNNRNNNQD